MGAKARHQKGMPEGVSEHTEFSRLLAEHGIFGIIAIFIMFWLPVRYYGKQKNPYSKMQFIAIISYSFLTMSHSAMRLALPGFLYGMAFLDLQAVQGHTTGIRWLKRMIPGTPNDSMPVHQTTQNRIQ